MNGLTYIALLSCSVLQIHSFLRNEHPLYQRGSGLISQFERHPVGVGASSGSRRFIKAAPSWKYGAAMRSKARPTNPVAVERTINAGVRAASLPNTVHGRGATLSSRPVQGRNINSGVNPYRRIDNSEPLIKLEDLQEGEWIPVSRSESSRSYPVRRDTLHRLQADSENVLSSVYNVEDNNNREYTVQYPELSGGVRGARGIDVVVAYAQEDFDALLEVNPNSPLEQNPNSPLEENPNSPLKENPNSPLGENPNSPLGENFNAYPEEHYTVFLESEDALPLEERGYPLRGEHSGYRSLFDDVTPSKIKKSIQELGTTRGIDGVGDMSKFSLFNQPGLTNFVPSTIFEIFETSGGDGTKGVKRYHWKPLSDAVTNMADPVVAFDAALEKLIIGSDNHEPVEPVPTQLSEQVPVAAVQQQTSALEKLVLSPEGLTPAFVPSEPVSSPRVSLDIPEPLSMAGESAIFGERLSSRLQTPLSSQEMFGKEFTKDINLATSGLKFENVNPRTSSAGLEFPAVSDLQEIVEVSEDTEELDAIFTNLVKSTAEQEEKNSPSGGTSGKATNIQGVGGKTAYAYKLKGNDETYFDRLNDDILSGEISRISAQANKFLSSPPSWLDQANWR